MASIKQGLSNIALFKSLSEDALEKIASSMTVSEVAAEQTVVSKGQVANEMFFLLSGTVKVIGGDGKVIDTAGPGSFFGELALVYDVPRQANVITVETCQLAVLSKINFNVFKSEYPAIINAIKEIADERFEKFKNVLRSADMGDPATFTDEQVNTFRQVFADVDSDGSGTIEIKELEELLTKLSGNRPTKSEVEKFMNSIDTDKSGSIDFDEFLNGLRFFAWLVSPSESKKASATAAPATTTATAASGTAARKPPVVKAASWNWPLIAGATVAVAAVGFAIFKIRGNNKKN